MTKWAHNVCITCSWLAVYFCNWGWFEKCTRLCSIASQGMVGLGLELGGSVIECRLSVNRISSPQQGILAVRQLYTATPPFQFQLSYCVSYWSSWMRGSSGLRHFVSVVTWQTVICDLSSAGAGYPFLFTPWTPCTQNSKCPWANLHPCCLSVNKTLKTQNALGQTYIHICCLSVNKNFPLFLTLLIRKLVLAVWFGIFETKFEVKLKVEKPTLHNNSCVVTWYHYGYSLVLALFYWSLHYRKLWLLIESFKSYLIIMKHFPKKKKW